MKLTLGGLNICMFCTNKIYTFSKSLRESLDNLTSADIENLMYNYNDKWKEIIGDNPQVDLTKKNWEKKSKSGLFRRSSSSKRVRLLRLPKPVENRVKYKKI